MSDDNRPINPDGSPPLPRPPGPQPRSGCLTAILFLVGLILLLPGLCAIIFAVGTLSSLHVDPTVMVLVIFGLLIGFGGIMLIRSAVRDPGP